MTSADPQVETCKRWHLAFRRLGYNSLPSDGRKPAMTSYARERDHGYPKGRVPAWSATCLQLCTGPRWGLVAIDLDGPLAVAAWEDLARFRANPRTWSVVNREVDGRLRGVHLYYAVSRAIESIPSRLLFGVWDEATGVWAKRSQIEFKGDRDLMVAPPSVHHKTGLPYAWSVGPDQMARPADLPAWVLDLPTCQAPAVVRPPFQLKVHRGPVLAPLGGVPDHHEVLDAIADKMALAESWGLRVARRDPNHAGWCKCHAIDREDRHPSAAFAPVAGRYWEPVMGNTSISLFELGVRAGAYSDWTEAMADLWARYRPRRSAG